MSKDIWVVDLREGDFDIWQSDIECESREEAIKLGVERAKYLGLREFSIGKKIQCAMASISADTIIEDAQEQLYDEVGEAAEYYLDDVTKEDYLELEKELNEVFYKWQERHSYKPNFFKIIAEEVIEL